MPGGSNNQKQTGRYSNLQIMKTRLDRLIVDRGLAGSREQAQALIMAGEVRVNGQKATKSGQPVAADCHVEVLARPPYVSRGGFKLARALGHFALDPRRGAVRLHDRHTHERPRMADRRVTGPADFRP